MRKPHTDKLNKLGKLRESVGKTRAEVVQAIGINRSFLSQIEMIGTNKKPSVKTAQKLCELYECSLEDIFPMKSNNTKSEKVG